MAIAPEQLNALRPHLLRFAQLQLRDTALAEDVVADTILAVLEHPERLVGFHFFNPVAVMPLAKGAPARTRIMKVTIQPPSATSVPT